MSDYKAELIARAESMPRVDQEKLHAAAPKLLAAMWIIVEATDSKMLDGDLARDLASECIFEVTGRRPTW